MPHFLPRRRCALAFVFFFGLFGPLPTVRAQNRPAIPSSAIILTVDARRAPQRVIHVHQEVPARPGPLTLLYPQWIPGTHGPSGPITRVANLALRAQDKPLEWQRDPLDPFAFRCRVPSGARTVAVDFDYLSPLSPDALEVSVGALSSRRIAVLNWNALLLYPKGRPAGEQIFAARVLLPPGWKAATALPRGVAQTGEEGVSFAPVSLETLIDSPVMAGANYKRIPLGPDHQMDLFGDSPEGTTLSPDAQTALRRMVEEAGALFGARHYERFHFLLALSDDLPPFGLEHHASTVNTVRANAFASDAPPRARRWAAYLLPHEYVHSWNGKFRRPRGMATPDYNRPMDTQLLWVYEGLSQYLSHVLEVRCGLTSADAYRNALAGLAAAQDHEAGRRWRSLEDVAAAYPVTSEGRFTGWENLIRATEDFYPEGELIWLDADTIVRERSGGTRSLDDFCKLFFGGPGGRAAVRPYTLDDVIAALNRVVSFDWATFFRDRVARPTEHAPLGGIERSGWRLVYAPMNAAAGGGGAGGGRGGGAGNLRYALGAVIDPGSGIVSAVLPGSPADRAGLRIGMKAVGVGGAEFSAGALRGAVQKAQETREPIALRIEDGDATQTLRIAYFDGERAPRLERDASRPDRLADILRPHAPNAPNAPALSGEAPSAR